MELLKAKVLALDLKLESWMELLLPSQALWREDLPFESLPAFLSFLYFFLVKAAEGRVN